MHGNVARVRAHACAEQSGIGAAGRVHPPFGVRPIDRDTRLIRVIHACYWSSFPKGACVRVDAMC